MDIKNIPDKGFTHLHQPMHADDILSAALLRQFNPNIVFSAGTTVPPEFDGVVFDIGGGEFDHHGEPEFRHTENGDGIQYAAFGKLCRDLLPQVMGEEGAKNFDDNFAGPMDKCDTTKYSNLLATVLRNYNAQWDNKDPSVPNENFEKAIQFVTPSLKFFLEVMPDEQKANDLMLGAGESPNKTRSVGVYRPFGLNGISIESPVSTAPTNLLDYDRCIIPKGELSASVLASMVLVQAAAPGIQFEIVDTVLASVRMEANTIVLGNDEHTQIRGEKYLNIGRDYSETVRDTFGPDRAFGTLSNTFKELVQPAFGISNEAAQNFYTGIGYYMDQHELGYVQDLYAAYLESIPAKDAIKEISEMIKNQLEFNFAYQRSVDIAKEAAEGIEDRKNPVMIIDQFVPAAKNAAIESIANFLIAPSARGGFTIQTLPNELGSRTSKVDFPKSWWGAAKEDLEKEVHGLTFCHNSGFIASADTLEHAIQTADKAWEIQRGEKMVEEDRSEPGNNRDEAI